MSRKNVLRTTLTPSGFHHIISVTIPKLSEDHDDCTRHVYLVLPPVMFVDPYELALYHEMYSFEHWGTRDLERPVAAVSKADSLVLINPRDTDSRTREITVDIPIHSRYGDLRSFESEGDVRYQKVTFEYPHGLMRCPISSTRDNQLEKLDIIPQRIERHFGTSSGHILSSLPGASPQSSDTPLVVHIPLGDPAHTFLVEVGTALIVLLCFMYVAWGAGQCGMRIYGKGALEGTLAVTKKAGKVKAE